MVNFTVILLLCLFDFFLYVLSLYGNLQYIYTVVLFAAGLICGTGVLTVWNVIRHVDSAAVFVAVGILIVQTIVSYKSISLLLWKYRSYDTCNQRH